MIQDQIFYCHGNITQAFGVNGEYYKQFGLNGHEGIDLIPSCGDRRILSLTDGIVTKDDDFAENRCYGNHVRIWDKKKNRVFIYAHMEYNKVSLGEKIYKGQCIGIMGNTGKVMKQNGDGAHLHLSCYRVNNKGEKLYPTNGFLGCINPLLEEYDV